MTPFSKIVMITLKGAEDRANKSIEQMVKLGIVDSPDGVHVHYGIRGDELPPSAWFKAGNGAWGCLMSHVRVLQDAWQDGVDDVLILEDDVCWVDNAAQIINEGWSELPKNWGQIYLGGQHRAEPEIINDYWMSGKSINRTHAYAVSRETIPQLLKHILYAPDYINQSYAPHIDHQLERAHRRGDWKVITPRFFVAGQFENLSQINGRHHPTKWWDWCNNENPVFPFVVKTVGRGDDKVTHASWSKDVQAMLEEGNHGDAVMNALRKTYSEAFGCRKLPSFVPTSPNQEALIGKIWPEGIIKLEDFSTEEIEDMLKPEKFYYTNKEDSKWQ